MHVCILSQSGYQGYSPVRDTWGVHIMRYVAFSHPRYDNREIIIIIKYDSHAFLTWSRGCAVALPRKV